MAQISLCSPLCSLPWNSTPSVWFTFKYFRRAPLSLKALWLPECNAASTLDSWCYYLVLRFILVTRFADLVQKLHCSLHLNTSYIFFLFSKHFCIVLQLAPAILQYNLLHSKQALSRFKSVISSVSYCMIQIYYSSFLNPSIIQVLFRYSPLHSVGTTFPLDWRSLETFDGNNSANDE